MVIDTSAIVALLTMEPEATRLAKAIEDDPVRLVSAGTLLETTIVVEARYGEAGGRELEALFSKAGVVVAPFTAEHAEIAKTAWRRYGKGRHAAGLNFGDCVSYALTQASGEPLLFKGQDFSQTDVAAVNY